jgi:hypothetical protein
MRANQTRPAMWTLPALMAALAMCAGCLELKDHLTINADGSGTVKLEVKSTLGGGEAAGMFGMMSAGAEGATEYPPMTRQAAQKLFAGRGITVNTAEAEDDKGVTTLTVEAVFNDINALLASPYGKARALWLQRAGEQLEFKSLSGVQMLAINPDDDEPGFGAMAAMAGAGFKRDDMRFEFRVTLPGPVRTTNGQKDGATVTWRIERAGLKDDAGFASAAGQVMEAACAAGGVAFEPVTPLRLALRSFAEAPAGPTDARPALPDAGQVQQAVRFEPYRLVVQRSLDLTGQGHGGANQATFTGAVVLPAELAPARFGEGQLKEVIDDHGRSLLPRRDDRASQRFQRSFGMTAAETQTDPTEKRHVVTLTFLPPERTARHLGKLSATLDLLYPGESQVVKIEQAIPADWIMDMTKPDARAMFRGGDDERTISSVDLSRAGLTISALMCMRQQGATMLMFNVKGDQADMTDLQVYDAHGKPWPTTLVVQPSWGEDTQCQVIVPGAAEAPLSLAVVVTQVGAKIPVNITLQRLALTKPAPAASPEAED